VADEVAPLVVASQQFPAAPSDRFIGRDSREFFCCTVPEGQDDALILAVTVCIDQMAHDVG
jgi:hypothetical protein